MSPRSRRPPERYFRTPVTAPGPQGGEMLRAFGLIRGNPLAFLEQVWQQHGDLVQFPIPKPPSYLVTDPEAVDRVLRVNQRAYGKRTIQYTSLSLVTGEGLLTADTEAWRQQRRVVQPSFHHSQVERVADHVGVACQRLDHEWSELPAGAVVDVDAAMMHVALEVVGRALFGTDLSGDAARLAHATLDALEVVVGKARNPLSPPLWVPTPGNLTLRRSLSVLDSAVARMLDERRVRPVGVAREPDMLDLLVEGFGTAPGDTRVRDQIITFLVAGHETVASALTWAWHLLGSAPHAATALRDEALAVLGQRAPTFADYTRLPYARAVVDEALRLYPPAWLITRTSREADVLAGREVPAGALVVMSPWLVHRHPDLWHDPERFDPSRFLATGASDPARLGYLPFGAGPRLCIGRDFALVEATLIMATIARRWRCDPVDAASVRAEPLVTVRPARGLPMRVRPAQEPD